MIACLKDGMSKQPHHHHHHHHASLLKIINKTGSLFRATPHIERWPDKSEVETHIVRAGHINDKPEGDKMLEALRRLQLSGYTSTVDELDSVAVSRTKCKIGF